ncbi:GNAT family N-acetyltransferase [Aeromonas cavernicola]|uniref:GNAT family N-acetyltransferase n=1 Tax=Aeromonas cavernicola TaxID=1006623 RepID=A0A2H9U9N9_9GAMM|nr:N-acetyltransferase [Aeromonas cavernicola]PJG60735.1 GNAT family N-acetyltransferase [Aeromonas cavernicola]
MLTVREASLDDLGAIARLEHYCFAPDLAFGRRRWRYLLAQAKGRTLLVLDERKQLMGYLCALEHKGWDRLVIQTLAIRWTIRRQGWARRLLAQVIQDARKANWGAIRLEVDNTNEGALALYQQLGFQFQQHLTNYYGDGQHGQRLVLRLGRDDIVGRQPHLDGVSHHLNASANAIPLRDNA